jgi:hypothetical protein
MILSAALSERHLQQLVPLAAGTGDPAFASMICCAADVRPASATGRLRTISSTG